MAPFGRWLGTEALVVMTVVAGGVPGLMVPAVAAQPPATARAAPAEGSSGPVSPTPASGTPALVPAGRTEIVRQLAQCGGTMYAVGRFTEISQAHVTYRVNNVISFSATAPFTLTGWAPDVNGIVNSIAFVGGDCTDAYLGGEFTSIGGTAVKNIAKVSTATGQVVRGFGHGANGQVETLLGYRDHLIVGGYFTSINNSGADAYMASLDPATGRNDGFIALGISGHYEYPGADANPTRVYNQQLSHSGTLDLVEGDFTSVGGQPRQQIFMLNLATSQATVTGWTSSDFDQHCFANHPFYVYGGAWSPNDDTVYVADTGYHPDGWNGSFPLTGLCDAAAAFPATQTSVSPDWINYTGCYSVFSVAADTSAVYVGGHEKYQNNPDGCKSAGSGAVTDPGLSGLSPSTGSVLLNSAGTAGRYSRGRGHLVYDLLLTSAGLWIASDNFDGTNKCGGESGFAGICFLPYPEG